MRCSTKCALKTPPQAAVGAALQVGQRVAQRHRQPGGARGLDHALVEVDALGRDALLAQQLEQLAAAAGELEHRPGQVAEVGHVVRAAPSRRVARVVAHVGVVVALEPLVAHRQLLDGRTSGAGRRAGPGSVPVSTQMASSKRRAVIGRPVRRLVDLHADDEGAVERRHLEGEVDAVAAGARRQRLGRAQAEHGDVAGAHEHDAHVAARAPSGRRCDLDVDAQVQRLARRGSGPTRAPPGRVRGDGGVHHVAADLLPAAPAAPTGRSVPRILRSVWTAKTGSPSYCTRPWSTTMPRVHSGSTRSSECVTNRIVLPACWNSAIFARHLRANASSPTASTSSMSSTSGSTCTAMENASLTYSPLE